MPPLPPPCPSREKLEALLCGGLPQDETTQIAGHLERCERCADLLSSIASDRAHVRRGGRERRLVPGTRPPKANRPWFWISMAAAVLLGGLLALRAQREPAVLELPPPGVAPPAVRAFARTRGEPRELTPPRVALLAGDRVRLAVDGARNQHLLVVGVTEDGAVRTLWPRASSGDDAKNVVSRRFELEDRGFLPGEVEISAAAGALRIFALFSGGVIQAADVARAVERALGKGGDLAALEKVDLPVAHTFTLYIVHQ